MKIIREAFCVEKEKSDNDLLDEVLEYERYGCYDICGCDD